MLAGVFWSTSGLFYRLIENATAWQVLFYRSLALLIMLTILLSFRHGTRLLNVFSVSLKPSLIGGFCLGIAFTGYILALEHTTVLNAMFILAFAPFITALLGRLILGEIIIGYIWICMTTTILGLGIMVGEELSLGRGLGELFALVAALGFSGMTISLRYNYKNDLLTTIFLASLFTTLFAAIIINIRDSEYILQTNDWIYSCGMGIFQIGFGFILYTSGAAQLKAVELTLLSLTEVILGPILVWAVIGETPSAIALFGGAIILGAIVMLAISSLMTEKEQNNI